MDFMYSLTRIDGWMLKMERWISRLAERKGNKLD